MGLAITQVDAFTDKSFKGNPAAVCVLPSPREDQWMQDVAAEMNLSETAFLLEREDGYNLRWFTPLAEVNLCGHATLASAHVLWEAGRLPTHKQARFHTRSGLLTAERKGEWIEMDFPATPVKPAAISRDILLALKTEGKFIGFNGADYLVEVDSEKIVRELSPDFALLRAVRTRGVMVTSLADSPGHDFISRFFAPSVGINEDPVTGSAHCCLGPYWGDRLGKKELVGYQASTRGGVVRVRLQNGRVILGGQAVTVFRGELFDSPGHARS